MKRENVRKRKMLLVLPLLVVPFVTMGFWALGGGKGKPGTQVSVKGLNLDLPAANLKEDRLLDKLSFYDQADKDSLQMEEWMRNDPYFKRDSSKARLPEELALLTTNTAAKYNQQLNTSPYEAGQPGPEKRLLEKLALLEKEMSKTTVASQEEPVRTTGLSSDPAFTDEVERLETMMDLTKTGSTEDPEIRQLSSVMDKILDIQHPGRVMEREEQKKVEQSSDVLSVMANAACDTLVKGFYGTGQHQATEVSNAIEAVVHEGQVLVNGAVIKLRLLQDIYISASKVPAGNFVFGIVLLNGERLTIEIRSIRHERSIYPVKMEVYDMDGLPGIYIPGGITREVAKQSADNSLQLMELSSMDPSLKAQAATAGINTAKSLISKKVKLVKVMVKAGYRIFLQDQTNP